MPGLWSSLGKNTKGINQPLVDCPVCDMPRLRKLVSVAGFRLSGAGWYETDFKKADAQKNVTKKYRDTSDKKSDNKKTDSQDGK